MICRLKFFISRLRERLWVKPLAMCILSIAAAFLVKTADYGRMGQFAPIISPETIETLLKVISASMLVIATFAVGSMVSSYTSASGTATPRSFPLIISDDVSQNALSSFIGAFIYSIVALIALLNGYYQTGGLFVLFCLTLLVFAAVILTFVRWVDCIARLGLLGNTIDKVESATLKACEERRLAPTLGGVPAKPQSDEGEPIYGSTVGYVRQVDVAKLQECAEVGDVRIRVASLPGAFSTPDQPLAYIIGKAPDPADVDTERMISAFKVGDDRTFDEDPRFGLVALSEIASRALSPAVNDPGTAIDIIGTFVRIFIFWNQPVDDDQKAPCKYDRVEIPELSIHDMFEDAFLAMGRDGAGTVEVGIRLQKAFHALANAGDSEMRDAAKTQSSLALARAELVLQLPEDLREIRRLSESVGAT
tara:strand:- start:3958 stop:5220 length:1263 start_codon:yes stop_codon:yes gene_type:complete